MPKKSKSRAKPSKKALKPPKAKKAKQVGVKAKKAKAARSAKPKKTRSAVSSKAKKAKPAARAKAKPSASAKPKRAKPKRVKASTPIRRRDASGHIEPSYAKELLARGDHSTDDSGRAFVTGGRTDDGLAEQLAEEFVEAATTGEDSGADVLDQQVDEESGGPFVETSGSREFAHGTDASNPLETEREPFPKV